MSRSRRVIVVQEEFDASQPAERMALFHEDGRPFGGAAVVEDLAEVAVSNFHDGLPSGWSVEGFQSIGPIHLEAYKSYLVLVNAEAIGNVLDPDAPDALSYTMYSVCAEEPDGEIAWASSAIPVAAEWPTSAFQGAGQLGWGGPSMVTPIGDTELYFLVGATNPLGDALPSEPVMVRNRRLAVLSV